MSGTITIIILLTLIAFGAISFPLFVYEAIVNFSKLTRKHLGYKIEVNEYHKEFEDLLNNIIRTHQGYYGSRIKVKRGS